MGTADASESRPVSAIDPPEIAHRRAGSRPTFAEKIIEVDLILVVPEAQKIGRHIANLLRREDEVRHGRM